MSGILGGLIGSFAPAAAPAFESIATATGTGSSDTITFSSIPSTYKHLQVRGIILPASASGYSWLTLNGNSGANYSRHQLQGNGTAASAAGSSSTNNIYIMNSIVAGYPAPLILDIIDYSSTSKYKTVRILTGIDTNGTSTGYVTLYSGLWRSTSAITSLSLISSSPNFATTTKFSLYGIKGA